MNPPMDNWLLDNILTFVLAFLIVGTLIPQILVIAYRRKLFDSNDERKVHIGSVPRLGGIAFVPGIIFSVLFTIGVRLQLNEPGIKDLLTLDLVPVFFLFCSLTLLFLVGIADDLVGVRYSVKFVFQIMAAALTVVSGVYVTDLHGFLGIGVMPDWAGWLLTGLLTVYIINSFNLIDGIDGLAAGLATLTLAYFGMAYYDAGSYIYSMIAFGGVGTLLPFLYFNVLGNANRNRKIFMGDTGSLTIGMVIAFLAVEFTNVREYDNIFAGVNTVVVAFSPLMIPMFDQLRVFFHRIVRHRNPFLPDRCHIHHKLLLLGLSSTQSLLCILGVASLMVAVNWILARFLDVNWVIGIDLALWIIGNMAITKALRRRERIVGEKLYD